MHDGLGLSQLRARVHAANLVLPDRDERHTMAPGASEFHGIGQIVFLGLVLIADAAEQVQKDIAAERHDAGVGQSDAAFLRRGVFLLPDGY